MYDSTQLKLFRTLYAATVANISRPTILRSYKSSRPSLNPTIVEVIGGAMATPSYCPPNKIGLNMQQQTFIVVPAIRELLKEASTIFGKKKPVAQTVSHKCEHLHVYSMESSTDTKGASRSVQDIAADCEAVAQTP
jgi:hypothetical protein